MSRYVALLRGINVGGRNKVAMADLRAAIGTLGYSDISTYIQSGNVLFSAGADSDSVAEAVRGVIARSLSLKVALVVVRRDELAAVISHNPYPDEPNPKYLHVVFLSDQPDAALLGKAAKAQQAAAAKGSRDSVTARGRVLYLNTPDGYGTSELAQAVLRITAPANGTARNLATTAKLLELCGD